MKKHILHAVATVTLAAALLPMAAQAQNAAVVNGQPLPKARVDAVVKQLNDQLTRAGRPVPPDLQDRVRQGLITSEVFVQEAKKRGLEGTDDFKTQMEMARQEILVNLLRDDYLKKNPVSDADVKAEYDKLVAANSGQEYKVRHILVDSEDKAKKIIADLKNGAKFEDLAKKESKDPGSAAKGGDLDWASPSSFVPEFSQAMLKLKKGETTATPVKTQFGWHVIRVDDIRKQSLPKLDDIKPQLKQQLEQAKVQKFLEDLRAKAKVE